MFKISDQQSYIDFKKYLKDNPNKILSVNGLVIETVDFKVEVDEQYSDLLTNLKLPVINSEYENDLIYGKDKTEGIVAIECVNDKLQLFMQDGSVQTRPAQYYYLCNNPLNHKFKKLNGNNHYKYIRRFTKRKEYDKSRYLAKKKNKDIYCIWDDVEANMVIQGLTLFKGMKIEDLKVLAFDIETNGFARDKNSKVFVITNSIKLNGKILTKQFRLDHFENGKEMIDSWCDWIREINPDIITGHNIFSFDFDFLIHYASINNTKLRLGRDNSEIVIPKRVRKKRVDGSQTWDFKNYKIFGRHIIDGIFLAVMYDIGKNYPSWGLKSIIEYEGFVSEDRQFYDASLIGKNWYNLVEREKIVNYCKHDGLDSLQIFNLMTPSFFYMAQSIPKPFQTIINGASGAWLNSIMVRTYLQENGSIPKADEQEYVAGGMSYGIAGVYKNVVKFDAASYYPHTILTFDIYDKSKDPKQYYLKMVKYFTNKRFEQKRKHKETGNKYFDDLQASSKIFINSAYGLLQTTGLNFNSPKKAALITKCCRAGLQKCVEWATNKPISYWWKEYYNKETSSQDFNNYDYIDTKAELKYKEMPRHDWKLVNLDTDSLSFCKKDNSLFTKEDYNLILKEINKIMYSEWEDDGSFDKVVVIKAKNYVLKNGNQIKLKGSSISDPKKEKALIEMLHTILIDCLIHETVDYVDIYHKYIKEALNVTDINKWSVKKSISEKMLTSERKNETKVMDALKGKDFQVGDKVYIFQDIDGQRQKIAKGKPVFLKDGTPKMEPNDIYRTVDEFTGTYDKWHYVKRVYKTIEILSPILDMNKIVNYNLKKNRKLVEDL